MHPRVILAFLVGALVFEIVAIFFVQSYKSIPEQIYTISTWQIVTVVTTGVFMVIFYQKSRLYSQGKLSNNSHRKLFVITCVTFFVLATGVFVDTFIVPQGQSAYREDVSADVFVSLPEEIQESFPSKADGKTFKTKMFDAWRTVFPYNIPLEAHDYSQRK